MTTSAVVRSMVVAMLLGFAMQAAADYVVLQSDAEAFQPGQLLTEESVIDLGDGESLVLISDGSDIFEVVGPFHGVPAGPSSEDFDLKTALVDLINSPDNVYASLGSTRFSGRNGEVDARRPPWALDPFESGTQCARSNSAVQFWRSDATGELMLAMQRPGVEGAGEISWATGESAADWPAEIPMVDNELHVIGRPGWMDKAIFQLVLIPDSIARNVETSIAWMAAHGCRTQARLLLPGLPTVP